jgi:hypothetical protein
MIGGLGNQLFQYAAGRRVAQKNGVPLKIDISPFSKYTLHKFGLHPFNISAGIATPDEIASVANVWQRVSSLYKPYYLRPIVKEQFFHFDPNILNLSGDVYLDGFWQSEKYFKDIEGLIHNELAIKIKPDAGNIKIANEIANSNAISLHVRRGDYVNNSKTNEVHGTCSLEYYGEATEIIARQIPNPHFFIFSDDPDWVQKNLIIDYATTYVTNNDADKNYEDLRLMSFCQHHIIANSSFSWWGAWLNPSSEKIVVAPKKWFGITERNSQDLIPEGWIIL